MALPKAIKNSLPRMLYGSGILAAAGLVALGISLGWNERERGRATERGVCDEGLGKVIEVWDGPYAVYVRLFRVSIAEKRVLHGRGWVRLPGSDTSSRAEADARAEAATAINVPCFFDPRDPEHMELDPQPHYRAPALLMLAGIVFGFFFFRRSLQEDERLTWGFHTEGLRRMHVPCDREQLGSRRLLTLSPRVKKGLDDAGFRIVGCMETGEIRTPAVDVYLHSDETSFAAVEGPDDVCISTLLEDGTVVETRGDLPPWWLTPTRYGPMLYQQHPAAGYYENAVPGDPSVAQLWEVHRASIAALAERRKTTVGRHASMRRFLALRRRAWDVLASRVRWVHASCGPVLVGAALAAVMVTLLQDLSPRAVFGLIVGLLVGVPVVWTLWLGPLVMLRLPVARRVPAAKMEEEEVEVQVEQLMELRALYDWWLERARRAGGVRS